MEAFKAEMKVMREMVQVEETCADTATLAALDQAWRQKVSGRWVWLEVAGGRAAALLFDWPGMGGVWHVCGSSPLWWGMFCAPGTLRMAQHPSNCKQSVSLVCRSFRAPRASRRCMPSSMIQLPWRGRRTQR